LSDARDLTSGSIGAHLTRMTIPMFLGIASMILASMTDTIFVGMIGAAELAAYSFTFPLMMGLSSVSMGLGTGASSLIARAEGAGDRDRVMRLATHAMVMSCGLVAVLVVAALFWQRELFEFMGASREILDLVMVYMNIWVLGLPLFTLPMIASTVLRAVGIAKLPGYIMVGASAVQILLTPVLAFGLLGVPELGFEGVAIASVLAGFVRTIPMLLVLTLGEKMLLFHRSSLHGIFDSTRQILYIALPSMLSSLIAPASMAVVLALLAAHSAEVVAGFGIASRIEMLVTMVIMSLSSSVAPFVGQNWGAGKIERVYAGLRISCLFAAAWGLGCVLFLWPTAEWLVAAINDDASLVESAVWYLWLTSLGIAPLGVGMMASSLFIALGKPIPPFLLSLIRTVGMIPLAFALDAQLGYVGIYAAGLAANTVMAAVAYIWGMRMLRGAAARLPERSDDQADRLTGAD